MMFFFFNETATTQIYTLSLHHALPISILFSVAAIAPAARRCRRTKRNHTRIGSGSAGETGRGAREGIDRVRSEEHTSELQSRQYIVCRLLLVKKNQLYRMNTRINSRHT